MLYDFTAAWCAPCKLLDRDWEDASVAERVNDAFVPVRIMDRVREEGRNAPDVAELQRRYEISVFPTLVVAARRRPPDREARRLPRQRTR